MLDIDVIPGIVSLDFCFGSKQYGHYDHDAYKSSGSLHLLGFDLKDLDLCKVYGFKTEPFKSGAKFQSYRSRRTGKILIRHR